MKNVLNALKTQVILSSVLSIVLGLTFIIWPLQITSMVCKVLAVVLIVIGAGRVIRYINKTGGMFVLVTGILELLFGLWVFFKPQSIQALIPIIIGVILLIHGIQDASMALQVKNAGNNSWWFDMLCAVLNIIFSLVLICNALGVVKIGMMLIGVMLVYDGVSDVIVAVKAGNVIKDLKEDSDVIDTTWRE